MVEELPSERSDIVMGLPEDDEILFQPVEDDGSPFRRAGYAERKLVSSLTSAIKVSRLHELDNIVAKDVLSAFHDVLSRYLSLTDHATILLGEKRLFVNGASVRMRRAGRSWLNEFMELMEFMGIAGLAVRGTWDYDAAKQLLHAFRNTKAKSPADRVQEIIENVRSVREPAWVEIYDEVHAAALGAAKGLEDLSDAARATFYYARLVSLMESSHKAVQEEGGSPDDHLRFIRQGIMKIVESLDARFFELRLLALTILEQSTSDPLATHAVNVCVLSLAMGRLLGLSRGQLANLGFAALYHDLGRAPMGRFPDPPGDKEDVEVATRHVIDGVRFSMQGKGYSDAALMRLIVSQEHHRVIDGFPSQTNLRPPHLFSRIVAIADIFDKLQNGTPWKIQVNPAEAMRTLLRDPKRYEPAIVDLLLGVLGKIPRGTLLRLSDASVVVVLEGGARRAHRPVVRRLQHKDGSLDEGWELFELEDPATEIAAEIRPEDTELDWRRAVTQ